MVYWFIPLQQARNSFDALFSYKGCLVLVERGSNYGVCKAKNNKTIKMETYKGKWFAEGDPHLCLIGFCL